MPPSAARRSAKAPLPEPRPVVRAAKAIPVLERKVATTGPEAGESETEAKVSLCKGRCGHCDLHPCQLHPTV